MACDKFKCKFFSKQGNQIFCSFISDGYAFINSPISLSTCNNCINGSSDLCDYCLSREACKHSQRSLAYVDN